MDEVAAKLDLIADLLSRRLELEERREADNVVQRRLAEERMREFKLDMPKIEMPAIDSRHEAAVERIEHVAEETNRERREFQSALLSEIRRHNDLIEQLLKNR